MPLHTLAAIEQTLPCLARGHISVHRGEIPKGAISQGLGKTAQKEFLHGELLLTGLPGELLLTGLPGELLLTGLPMQPGPDSYRDATNRSRCDRPG